MVCWFLDYQKYNQHRVNKLNKYVSLIYEVSIVSPSLQQSLYHFVLSVSRLVPTHSQTSVSIHDDSNDLNDLPVNHLSHNQSIPHTYSNNTHFKWRRQFFTISIILFITYTIQYILWRKTSYPNNHAYSRFLIHVSIQESSREFEVSKNHLLLNSISSTITTSIYSLTLIIHTIYTQFHLIIIHTPLHSLLYFHLLLLNELLYHE